eukprot:6065966-Heterocapsa_arctica.AAC.1
MKQNQPDKQVEDKEEIRADRYRHQVSNDDAHTSDPCKQEFHNNYHLDDNKHSHTINHRHRAKLVQHNKSQKLKCSSRKSCNKYIRVLLAHIAG